MTFRHLLPLVLALAAQFITRLHAQTVDEQIAAITAQFQEAYDRDVAKPHETAVADLNSKYATALERALDASTSAGNLEASLRLREEQARLTEKKPLPSTDPETLPESLKSLRATYRATLAGLESTKQQTGLPLLQALDEQLEALQVELTQAKQIDDALLVQARREDLKTQAIAQKAANPIAAAANTAPSDWLDLARRRGGRLKLWGGPEPGAPIEVPTKAAKYDDYEPRNVANVSAGEVPAYLGQNGSVYRRDGTELFDPRNVKKPVGFAHGYRTGLIFDEEGEMEVFKMNEGLEPPPADFIKGNEILTAAANNSITFVTTNGEVLMWDCEKKTRLPLPQLEGKQVVEVAASSAFAFRTSDGRVLVCDNHGAFGYGTIPAAATQVMRTETQPFVKVHATTAQRADGTWVSWTHTPEMEKKIQSLGAALDLDAFRGKTAFPVGVLAWIELPPGTKPDVSSGNTTPPSKP